MILSPYGKCSLRPLGRANRDEEVLKNLTLLTGDEGPWAMVTPIKAIW